MSDTTRQDFSDRAKAALQPQSTKTSQQVAQEEIRGKTDKMQAAAQPESEKSYMQKAADSIRGMTEGSGSSTSTSHPQGSSWSGTSAGTSPSSTTMSGHQEEDKGLLEKARDTMSSMFSGSSTEPSS